jgi:hypothetical protein
MTYSEPTPEQEIGGQESTEQESTEQESTEQDAAQQDAAEQSVEPGKNQGDPLFEATEGGGGPAGQPEPGTGTSATA